MPIIVVTSVGQIVTKETVLTRGADDFVTKPVQPDDIRTRVCALLRVRRVKEDLARTLAYIQELEAARHAQRRIALAEARGDEGVGRSSGGQPVAILLVDDEPLARTYFTDLLTEQGFQVIVAASGAEALDLARRHPIEAAIVDVVMPGMSGLEVMEQLQARDAELPVIMLTGHPASLYSLAAMKMGAFDFVTKGVSPHLVGLSVHRAVRHRRAVVSLRDEISALRVQLAGSAPRQGVLDPT